MDRKSSKPDDWENPSQDEIERILRGSKVVAVVGLSNNESRASHEVARFLIEKGYEVIPVNPGVAEVLGRKSYPDLASIGREVDIVDIFRNAEVTPPIVDEAIAIGARYIWLQLGIVSEESYRKASQASVPIVMDRCVKRELQRLEC